MKSGRPSHRLEVYLGGLTHVFAIPTGHRNRDGNPAAATLRKNQLVTPGQTFKCQGEPTETITLVRIRTGKVDGQLGSELIKGRLQAPLERLEIFRVFGPIPE